jgi:hypothetical protein
MAYKRLPGWLLVLPLVGGVAGCFAGSQNPGYFPNLLPTGDIVHPHAGPIGPSYYENYDPHAVDLAVEPAAMTSQVGSQVIVLATVRDEKGVPRRNRRVDWLVTGGHLVEVDESGFLNGRGANDGTRGFSFTSIDEHRLTRGNTDKADDVMIRPGQSWCVVSSPTEGDTHVQVVVPGIANWDKRMKTSIIRWVDASWLLPPPATANADAGYDFVTKITRFTDGKPLTKYRVRYKIIDGPPAILLPRRTDEEVVVSDLDGLAKARIVQLMVGPGVNRVSVEIIRPPDPTVSSGAGVSIVRGETSIEWLVPGVAPPPVGPNPPLGPPAPAPEIKLGPPAPGPVAPLGPPASQAPASAIKLGPPSSLDGPTPR